MPYGDMSPVTKMSLPTGRVSVLGYPNDKSWMLLPSIVEVIPTKPEWKVSNMAEVSQAAQQAAAHHMTEMVGSAVGITLLAADDLPQAKANLIESINGFPAETRDLIPPDQKTAMLTEHARQVRWHARELHRILQCIAGPQPPADDLTAPEDAPQAPQTPDSDGTPAPE